MSPFRVEELKQRQRRLDRKYNDGATRRFEIGPITYSFFAIIAVGTMAMLYLTQSNRLATLGYDLNDLKREQQQLQADNERFTVEITRLQSVSVAEDTLGKTNHNGMVPAKVVTYVAPTTGAIARK